MKIKRIDYSNVKISLRRKCLFGIFTCSHITFAIVYSFYFRLFSLNELNSNKNPGVFCNSETIFCFFSYIISKFFVVVNDILVLIAMAGKNVRY